MLSQVGFFIVQMTAVMIIQSNFMKQKKGEIDTYIQFAHIHPFTLLFMSLMGI